MRFTQILCTVGLIVATTQAWAGQESKQCEKYAVPCKASSAVKQASGTEAKLQVIHQCIVQAASLDGQAGTACLKEQEGHKHQ